VFVAALPDSGYAYAKAFLKRDQEAWTSAQVYAYNFLGGITRVVVPDNLKTGVVKHTKVDIVLNKVYQELTEHYGTVILPARVRAPKDKPTRKVRLAISRPSFWQLGPRLRASTRHRPQASTPARGALWAW
jgi:transposase